MEFTSAGGKPKPNPQHWPHKNHPRGFPRLISSETAPDQKALHQWFWRKDTIMQLHPKARTNSNWRSVFWLLSRWFFSLLHPHTPLFFFGNLNNCLAMQPVLQWRQRQACREMTWKKNWCMVLKTKSCSFISAPFVCTLHTLYSMYRVITLQKLI